MKQSTFFWNMIAKRYARQPIADEASYQTKLAKTREYLRPPMRVLEFGCGTGGTALLHAPFVSRIDAIDYAPRMIAIARGRARQAGVENVRFETAAIEDWPEAAGPYDAVLGLSILHLVQDRPACIAKVWRLLKPGGVFISSTACLGGKLPLLRLLAPLGSALRLLPVLRFFTPEELRDELTDTGFGIEHFWQPGADKAVFIIARKP